MNIPSQILTLLAGILITLVSLWYGQNHGLLPVAASEEAAQVDGIFNFMMTIATGLFLLIQGVLLVAIFRFRRKPGDNTDGPPIEGNVPLEITWTAIPAIIVLVISIYSFEVYNTMGGLDPDVSRDPGLKEVPVHQAQASSDLVALDPTKGQIALGLGASPDKVGQQAPLAIDVNAIQFAWIFKYIDDNITTGELHIPVGREIKLNITAGDVIHAFWLPEFRLKQDAVPGRESQLRFTANRVGEYPIICAELCGAYHGAMKSQLYVHTPEDYQEWIQQQQIAQRDTLDETVAINPANRSDSEFLTPYAQDMGVKAETLQQLKTLHSHAAHH